MAAAAKSPDLSTRRAELHLVRDSDGELLARIAGRDQMAFEAFHRCYARPVFGMALRRLGDRGRAEDVVQEVFTAVWRSAASYRPERGPAAPWLYRIAHNAIVNSTRVSSRFRHTPLDQAPEPVSSEPIPDQSAEEEWRAFAVHAAVAALPECERVLLELAYWHGHSQREIAHLLRLPLGTVKTRTRRGLARLAVALEGTV